MGCYDECYMESMNMCMPYYGLDRYHTCMAEYQSSCVNYCLYYQLGYPLYDCVSYMYNNHEAMCGVEFNYNYNYCMNN